jgi:hypothetical protein
MFYFNLTTNYYKNEEKLQLLFEAAKSILGQLEIWCSVFWPIEHLSDRHFAESNLAQSMFGWQSYDIWRIVMFHPGKSY